MPRAPHTVRRADLTGPQRRLVDALFRMADETAAKAPQRATKPSSRAA